MANLKVRLLKRVKVTDELTPEDLERLSQAAPEKEFIRFWEDLKKAPWRFCPVASEKGRVTLGRVKLPGLSFKVIVGETEVLQTVEGPEVNVSRHTGSLHIDYRENGTRMRPTVLKVLKEAGRDRVTTANLSLRDVLDAIGIVERRLNGIKHGDIVLTEKTAGKKKVKDAKVLIKDHISRWLADRAPDEGHTAANASGESTLAEDTYRNYSRVLRIFGEFLLENRGRQNMEDITSEDLKGYYGYLASIPNKRSETGVGMAESSRNVKLTIVSTFLRTSGRADVLENWNGVRKVPTVKRTRNEETDISDYTNEQMEALFKEMDLEEAELFTFFLSTGMRAGEVAVAEWHELDPKQGLVQIRRKWVTMGNGTRKYWVPKYKRERDIPVPQSLFATLEARRKRVPKSNLIFPTEQDLPKGVFLRILKSVAHRAGLDCGRCMGCRNYARTKKGGCEEFYLHRWRHTFACTHLRGNPNGTGKFDVKTVSTWLGHRSIKTTERYLHAAEGREVQAKINVGPLSRSTLVADKQTSLESP